MLRNIFRYFCGLTLALAGGIGLAGCSDDNNGLDIPQEQIPESGYITLNLKCVEGTRADDYTEPGVEGLNENLIKTVTVCLWSKGGDKPDGTATPDYVQTFSGLNEQDAVTVRIPLTVALQHKLFETSEGKCHAFAAVNVGLPEEENFTIADYRNKVVESTFSSKKSQDFFTMDGDAEVSYNPVTNAATGSIELQRSASKITLALAVDEIIEQNAVVGGELVKSRWKSDANAMRVWLYGGLAESTLDPDMTATPGQDYFFRTPDNLTYTFVRGNTDNGDNAPIVNEETQEQLKYPYKQDTPFYTYPHSWTAEPGDYKATYMILSVPWMQVDEEGNHIAGTTWRTCYYQVPVIAENSTALELIRNTSYHIYLHVGLLGSFEPDVPLELDELEYSAAQWGNVNIDVTIPDVRYLVVNQNNYTVNNETSITIPFYTSHETIVTDATMTFYRYNFDDVGRERAVTVTMSQNELSVIKAGAPVFTADFDNKTKELTVTHELVMYEALDNSGQVISFTNNDTPTTGRRAPKTKADWENYVIARIRYFRKQQPSQMVPDVSEYSRVEFKITLQHKDMTGSTNFKEEITITQYPGIYIETTQNYCPDLVSFSCTGAEGNTFINGNSSNAPYTSDVAPSYANREGWMRSIGLSSGNNNFNPNLYLITVTTLPQTDEYAKYKIGDPRTKEINNNLGSDLDAEGITTSPQLKLVTTGINGPIKTGVQTTPWDGQTYEWDHNGKGVPGYNSGSITVVGFKEAKSIYPSEDRRNIRYYYPTQEDDAHKYFIAPKFRICSSYAGTNWVLNRELSRRRAAAYQELGYAAGRWRLPTFGEVKFIMQLAAQFKIPRLFGTYGNTLATATQANSSWWYWCANGLVHVPGKGVIDTPPTLPGDPEYMPHSYTDCQRARFVYDEWYWGKADLPHTGTIGSANCVYTFTWGDKPF